MTIPNVSCVQYCSADIPLFGLATFLGLNKVAFLILLGNDYHHTWQLLMLTGVKGAGNHNYPQVS